MQPELRNVFATAFRNYLNNVPAGAHETVFAKRLTMIPVLLLIAMLL